MINYNTLSVISSFSDKICNPLVWTLYMYTTFQRYYGESMPFGSSSFDLDKVGYLSIEQAMADFAVLVTHFKEDFKAVDKPVVAFGGR